MATRKVACVGDSTSTPGHGGVVNFSGQSGQKKAAGAVMACQGATFSCTTPTHGVTPIAPNTVKSFIEGKLIIVEGAVAGCGAVINVVPDRKVYVE